MNPSRRSVWCLALLNLSLIAVIGGLSAPSLTGQISAPVRDNSLANVEPYLYAAEDFGIDPAGVTYHKDIAPILRENCVKCHTTEGMAPMALPTYREVGGLAGREDCRGVCLLEGVILDDQMHRAAPPAPLAENAFSHQCIPRHLVDFFGYARRPVLQHGQQRLVADVRSVGRHHIEDHVSKYVVPLRHLSDLRSRRFQYPAMS